MRVINLPARTGCPTSEELAAFIDGRLQGPERERIVEHLATCEDCYGVFTGVVDFNEQEGGASGKDDGEEEAEDPPVAEVVQFPAKRPWRWQAPLRFAACLVAGAGGAILLYSYWSLPPSLKSEKLLAAVEPQATSLAESTWYIESKTRGIGDAPTELASTAFLLGAYWIDLQTLAIAGDSETLSELSRTFLHLSGAASSEEAGYFADLDPALVRLLKQAEANQAPPNVLLAGLRARERGLARYFARQEIPEFSLGRWAESGRLAALARDARLLDPRWQGRRYLRWLLEHREKLMLSDQLVERLETIEATSQVQKPGEEKYTDLEQSFEALIRYFSVESD